MGVIWCGVTADARARDMWCHLSYLILAPITSQEWIARRCYDGSTCQMPLPSRIMSTASLPREGFKARPRILAQCARGAKVGKNRKSFKSCGSASCLSLISNALTHYFSPTKATAKTRFPQHPWVAAAQKLIIKLPRKRLLLGKRKGIWTVDH